MIAVVLALLMCLAAFTACKKAEETPSTSESTEVTPSATQEISTTPLVVGLPQFSEKFSPFFADTGYDQEIVNLVGVQLITTDRLGGIVYNAIEGETIPYNGTDYTYTGLADLKVNYDEAKDQTVYDWKIRDDVKFSDGEALTADDIIFSYYAYCDPSYNGSVTLYSVPIVGLKNYRTQTSDEVYAKYDAMFDAIYAAGEDHVWASTDSWTQDQQTSFWTIMKSEWTKDTQAIVDYCMANYLGDYGEATIGFTPDEITAEPGLQVAFGIAFWGFGEVADGVLTGVSGKTFDLKGGVYPTIDDYYTEAYTKYAGDPSAYDATPEPADGTGVMDEARNTFINTEGPKDPSMSGGVPNIAGIKKVSDTEVTVTTEGFDATAVYNLGIFVSPLHYYGDEAKYDYDNNKFGFDFKDLSSVTDKTTQPLGAGPYRFVKYENKVVYLEANENYYKGMPKTYYVQYKETVDADMVSGVQAGTIDVANPTFNNTAVDEIKKDNPNGEITGEVITTSTVDNLGYGYIGMNATTVNVGGEPASDASKDLRKAFATVFAAYRNLTVSSYYGERASVINYPISNTSWAAPQSTDEGYQVAYSIGVDGAPIYTSDMTEDQKYSAALQAAIGYLKAAGYTFDEASGKFTAAPAGAKLEYEVIIAADGLHDHPSYLLLQKSSEALATIGITLTINDPADSNVLWNALDAGTQEMWVAAWQATIDPDMYQVYHSSNIVGLPGSSESNHYHIQDAKLDEQIMAARTSADQAYRKSVYKSCLDIILDWAVEIPVYQRQNCIIFSSERVNMDTVTPDITTFWNWYSDIEKLEVYDVE
jgi:peptide/nickel transport system substrate-binding protein